MGGIIVGILALAGIFCLGVAYNHALKVERSRSRLPQPSYCRHGSVITTGYIDGFRIAGTGCAECQREMYGSDGFRRCAHGVIGGNACAKCIARNWR